MLGQNTLGRHLTDVRWSEVSPIAEAILKLSYIDSFRVDGGDHFIQFLLRGDNDPTGSIDLAGLEQVFADLAELFDCSSEVFDLVTTPGHMLAHLVDDEDQRFSWPTAGHKVESSLNNPADGNCTITTLLGMRP